MTSAGKQLEARYHFGMTLPHSGQRRVHPSETRELANRARTESGAHVSARAFWAAFVVILLAIAAFALILRWT